MSKTVMIEGMSCAHCVSHVTTALQGLTGVKKVKVDLKKKQAEVEGSADDAAIKAAVADAGYEVTGITNA